MLAVVWLRGTVLESMDHSSALLRPQFLIVHIPYLAEHLSHVLGAVEAICLVSGVVFALHSRTLVGARARHVQDVVHIPNFEFSASIGGRRSLLVFLQSHVVIFNGLCKVTSFILTRSSSICRIYMVRVNLEHDCEIFDGLVNLAQFLEGASSDVIRACVALV